MVTPDPGGGGRRFNRLKALGDSLHGDLEVTTAMRAVMETLSASGGDDGAAESRSSRRDAPATFSF